MTDQAFRAQLVVHASCRGAFHYHFIPPTTITQVAGAVPQPHVPPGATPPSSISISPPHLFSFVRPHAQSPPTTTKQPPPHRTLSAKGIIPTTTLASPSLHLRHSTNPPPRPTVHPSLATLISFLPFTATRWPSSTSVPRPFWPVPEPLRAYACLRGGQPVQPLRSA